MEALGAEVQRLRAENDSLRAENKSLRGLVGSSPHLARLQPPTIKQEATEHLANLLLSPGDHHPRAPPRATSSSILSTNGQALALVADSFGAGIGGDQYRTATRRKGRDLQGELLDLLLPNWCWCRSRTRWHQNSGSS